MLTEVPSCHVKCIFVVHPTFVFIGPMLTINLISKVIKTYFLREMVNVMNQMKISLARTKAKVAFS